VRTTSTWIAPLLLGAAAFAGSGDFERTTFGNFERFRETPAGNQEYRIDSARPGLAVVVSQACAVREIPSDKLAFLHGLGKVFSRPEVFDLYRRELRVEERGHEHWIPFQEPTMEHLLAHACDLPEITVRVRYLGVHRDLGRVYIGIGYDGGDVQRPDPMTCFADNLHGVRIGEPLDGVRARMTERYGTEHRPPPRGSVRYFAWAADPEHQTTLVVAGAGEGPAARVFSVQVSGPPNSGLELPGGLRLGDPPEKIEHALGAPDAERDTGDGYRMLSYSGSPCSVELKDGILASVLIMVDPNEFDEDAAP
jgi:hypothetical protein